MRIRLWPGKDVGEWAWLFAPSALLLIPFVRFVKSNAYPFLAPEILLITLGFVIVGVFLGVLGRLGLIFRVFGFAAALTIVIDVQTRWFFDYNLAQYVWLPIGLYLILLVSPTFVRTFSVVAVYAMMVATALTPGSAPIQMTDSRQGASDESARTAGAKPETYWIHLILDEHIGIESIPVEFDPDRRLAKQLRNDYVDDGFVVYTRAFTRFPQTHMSLPSIFNLAHAHPRHFVSAATPSPFSLVRSEYLERLKSQGYDVRVYSMDYLRLCELGGDSWTDVCIRYSANSIWGISDSTLSVPDRTLLILRIFSRLSKVIMKLVLAADLDGRFSLPQSATPLMGLEVIKHFRNELLQAKPGSVWLVHVPLPHNPYALKSDCSLKSFPWRENGKDTDQYEKNSAEDRRVSYPQFLEQVECLNKVMQSLFDDMKGAGIYEKAHIVVHGDHGSRIATHNLRVRPTYRADFQPSPETLLDYFGTLFAYKPAGATVGDYRRDVVPIADLLEMTVSGQLVDGDIDAGVPTAYLVEWGDQGCEKSIADDIKGCRLIPLKLPPFAHGRIGLETDGSSD